MGFCCFYKPNLGMESVTCKGREACIEPSQFHVLFSFMEDLNEQVGKIGSRKSGQDQKKHRAA